jgi:hypothetical protein
MTYNRIYKILEIGPIKWISAKFFLLEFSPIYGWSPTTKQNGQITYKKA